MNEVIKIFDGVSILYINKRRFISIDAKHNNLKLL
jgi:hypothetical protein